jgi:hypothetical protein
MPGTYRSTSRGRGGPVGARRGSPGSGTPRLPPPRASSARTTPRLADSDTGLTTTGVPSARRWAAPTSSVRADHAVAGWDAVGAPVEPFAQQALSRVAATAAGGLWGQAERAEASAATSTPRSSTPTTASIGGAGRAPRDGRPRCRDRAGRRAPRSPMTDARASMCGRRRRRPRPPAAPRHRGSRRRGRSWTERPATSVGACGDTRLTASWRRPAGCGTGSGRPGEALWRRYGARPSFS